MSDSIAMCSGLVQERIRLTGELHELRECNESSSLYFLDWSQRHGRGGEIYAGGAALVRRKLILGTVSSTILIPSTLLKMARFGCPLALPCTGAVRCRQK